LAERLIIVFLVAVILCLLVPLTNQYYYSEQAFTADNFIRVYLVAK
jgi:hypothetical protein